MPRHNKAGRSLARIVDVAQVERAIHELRGQRIILDADLAGLYGVATKRLNEQRKRNPGRFPRDFAFQLTAEEDAALRSHFATSKPGRGGKRYPSWAFTEHGAIMAANVLNSPRAIEVSVLVVRAFVRIRQLVISHGDLSRRLDELEVRYDAQFKVILDAIRALMVPVTPRTRPIGYRR